MLNHIIQFAVIGLVLAFVFAAADKLIAKVEDAKKRRYIKIAVYAVLMFCGTCAVDTVVRGW